MFEHCSVSLDVVMSHAGSLESPRRACQDPRMRWLVVSSCLAVLAAPVHAGEVARSIGLYPPTGPALALVTSRIELAVRGPIVEGVVTQRFENRGDRATEATYVFPLPPDAAVTGLAITSGPRTIRAAIATREEAQRRYEEAVRAGRAGALLEGERPDVLTQTIAAIPARGVVEVTLRFDATVARTAGGWELALPLVVAPRFVPGVATGRPTTGTGRAPDTDRAPDASRVTPGGAPGAGGATEVVVRFADRALELASPTHELRVASSGLEAALVDRTSDHDVVLRWRSAAAATGWVETAPGGGGYAAVLVEAPPAGPRKGSMRCALVIDGSARSLGDARATTQPMVRALLAALTPADRVSAAGIVDVAMGDPAALARQLERAWAEPPVAFDLTRVLGAQRGGAPIVLVTGGLVADDAAAIRAAAALGVPIHVVGVGPAPARATLVRIATASGGTVRFPSGGDDVRALALAVLADVAAPPAPLAVTWGTLGASDVVPGTLPRLGAGQAVLVLARVRSVAVANARANGELFAIAPLAAAPAVPGAMTALGPLARRWARLRLDELIAAGAPAAAITAHALRAGLVSPRTSLVAIGEETVVQGGVKRSVAVPVSVPAGMRWEVFEHEERDSWETGRKSKREPAAKADPSSPKTQPEGGEARPDADDGGYRNAPAVAQEPLPEPSRGEITVEGRSVDEVVSLQFEAMSTGYRARRWRLALGAAGGVQRSGGETTALAALATRLELRATPRLWAGVDGELQIEAGELRGRLGLTVGRRVGFLELGAALGLAVGDGVGPSAGIVLRGAAPRLPQLAPFLRVDVARLYVDDATRARSAFALGLEYRF
jgi:Ca-activated chloride channel homolog